MSFNPLVSLCAGGEGEGEGEEEGDDSFDASFSLNRGSPATAGDPITK